MQTVFAMIGSGIVSLLIGVGVIKTSLVYNEREITKLRKDFDDCGRRHTAVMDEVKEAMTEIKISVARLDEREIEIKKQVDKIWTKLNGKQ